MTEWVYKATRSRRSLKDTGTLAKEHGFLARSAFGERGQWIANVRKVLPGDVIHVYYREDKAYQPIGSFSVLEGTDDTDRFGPVEQASLVTVRETPENRALLDLLAALPTHAEGIAYKPDPVLRVFTGWRVAPASLTPPPYKKSLFPGRGTLQRYERITLDPRVMGGKACIRGLRVTVGAVVDLVAAGHSVQSILDAYPYLEAADIPAALRYAAWRTKEHDLPLSA